MGLFDRFKKKRPDASSVVADDATDVAEDVDVPQDAADPSAEAPVEDDEFVVDPKEAPRDRTEKGPFDVDDSVPDRHRLKMGALAVPVLDGMQIRLETEEKSDRVLGVTMVHGKAAMQLQVFAAPRGEGLWKSIRDEIADGVRRRRGKADELYTDLGNELVCQVPVRAKDGRTGVRVTRFAGIDGPRWFLRAVFSGTAVTEKEPRAELVDLLRGVVVDRGGDAMPPRELIPLTAPNITPAKTADGEQAAGVQTDAEPADSDDLNPFERGPEIAEVR
ncbi:MAG: DUF3710 domain-containing protein [Brevibacterium yomogidense]|uniref:DUF3710 domain-containing protein n=1 Tax=Brevibacterium yomogidense TaxID=946573 RepID=A0A1X6XEU4_9MICO|nr:MULTISPECIES: DUF3710 domain-containing protein [Brevibacterium]SLM97678.1 hypothetical protein FM105_07515 [Brevibacterium yomogidense]SMX68741.1 Protein of unknown function (DUF3710) [Brevibacterium sp. Mu109]